MTSYQQLAKIIVVVMPVTEGDAAKCEISVH